MGENADLPVVAEAAAEAVAAALPALGTPDAASALEPWIFCAAVLFGTPSPNPQPPSRSCAMTGPAHLPDLKPQQPDAQSESWAQGPVMNCVPWGTRGMTAAVARSATAEENERRGRREAVEGPTVDEEEGAENSHR